MRKILASLLLIIPALSFGASGPVNLVNDPGVSYSTTYPQNLGQYGNAQASAGKLSAQITSSSASFPTDSFTDGQQSTGSITVTSNAIVSAPATDNLTVPATSAILAATASGNITISSGVAGSTVFVNGNSLTEGVNWARGTTTTTAAAALSAAINTYIGAVTSTNVANVIYATATVAGAAGNAYTITSSSAAAYTVTAFSGGHDRGLNGATITVNGISRRNGYEWTDASNTSTGTAISITAMLNGFGVIQATTSSSVVYATATTNGSGGNTFSLASSTPLITVANAKFTGGMDAGNVSINGKTFTYGVNFTTGSTTSITATNLANAINAFSPRVVTATPSTNVITLTSVATGASVNYTLASSTDTALTLSPPKTVTNGTSSSVMTGGKASSYSAGSANITIPAHALSKGLPVTLATNSAVIGPLANATLYYAIPIDANTIQLATTSLLAQSGSGVVITSSSTGTTAHTLTLTPQAVSGTSSAKWQVSNDGINWADFTTTSQGIAISSQTFSASATVVQDFGMVDYGWIRYNFAAAAQGATKLNVILNAKD